MKQNVFVLFSDDADWCLRCSILLANAIPSSDFSVIDLRPKFNKKHICHSKYRWVPGNPNMDNPNCWIIRGAKEITPLSLMCYSAHLTQNLVNLKEFSLVFLFRINRDPPACESQSMHGNWLVSPTLTGYPNCICALLVVWSIGLSVNDVE